MSSPVAQILTPLEMVDNDMNGLRIQDGDVVMEPSTPAPSDEELIENSRALHIETKDDATVEEQASLPSIEERIVTLNGKIQKLESRLRQVTKPFTSSTPKTAATTSSLSEHPERKLVLDDTIPRYGKYTSVSFDQSRKSYRVISNAMEFLDVFHSRASSIHGDNFLSVCSRLLSLAILDDAERQRTFIDELKTAHQKTREVIQAVKACMIKGESYKRYAWRLERINRIYKIGGSAFREQVVAHLELSIPATTLDQLNVLLTVLHVQGTSDRTFQRATTIKDFCRSLVHLAGPEDCDDRRHSHEHADRDDNGDGARPAKRAKSRHDNKDSDVFGKSGQTFFCRNGCGTNKTHDTEGCLICGNCKARGHLADKCPKDAKKVNFPNAAAASNQRQGHHGSFNAKGRNHGGKPYQCGNHQGSGANAQNSNGRGNLTESISSHTSESPVAKISNSTISLNVAQPKPKLPSDMGSNNYFVNKLKGIEPIFSLSDAIDTTNVAAADSSPHSGSSPIVFAAVNVHPLHTASEDALHFPRGEGRRVVSGDMRSAYDLISCVIDDDDDTLIDLLNGTNVYSAGNNITHKQYSAIAKKDNSSEQRLIVKISIFDHELEALIDTGASHSSINSKVVKQYNISVKQTSGQIELADKSIIPRIGETENVDVTCGNHIVSASFKVINQKYAIITIGMDLFYRFGFHIQGLPDIEDTKSRLAEPTPDERAKLRPLTVPEEEKTEAFQAERKIFLDKTRPLLHQ
ncbi:hypothetical protein BGZ80_003440 [Entomortierella chlamydospora]|uniref:Uncharacterized protein n=1 Tax=Entomortierella chlamydospora TaxID=101097 RepID=A0A9P6N0N2_9FUNG|nr:hypothetical protein BGZ80_003440 [Entomortierella chlamydospora]